WPTAFNSGQSVCSGCGSEVISCARESLLMNVTRVPRGTVRLAGQTALFRIRNVVAGFGMVEQVMFADGAEPELPPQAAVTAAAAAATTMTRASLTHIIASPAD